MFLVAGTSTRATGPENTAAMSMSALIRAATAVPSGPSLHNHSPRATLRRSRRNSSSRASSRGPRRTHAPSVVHRRNGWGRVSGQGNDGSGKCLVLDPFAGSGTTLLVAERLGRQAVGIEINPEYVEMAKRRLSKVQLALPL